MSEINADDPILESDYFQALLTQLKAMPRSEGKSPAELLSPLIKKSDIADAMQCGAPDAETTQRIEAFYAAIGSLIEAECGHMAMTLVQISSEGIGRAVVTVGKLVVVDKQLRDLHGFGFTSLSKLKNEADKLLSVATTLVGEHAVIAGL